MNLIKPLLAVATLVSTASWTSSNTIQPVESVSAVNFHDAIDAGSGGRAVNVGYIPSTEVGDTCDACQKDNSVKFAIKGGDAIVKAGESGIYDLESMTNEIVWFCDGTRERCANEQPFNRVRCERAGNGAITWTFYVK